MPDYYKVDLATRIAGEDIATDIMTVEERALAVQMSASAVVKAGPGRLLGVFCSSSSAGTIAFYNYNSAATNNKIIDTVSLTAGQMIRFPAIVMDVGIYAVIGGTAQVTVFYQ